MPTITVPARDAKILISVAVLVPRSDRQDPEPSRALVDTGAQISAIGPRVVEWFGADPYLTTTMRTASGVAEPAHLFRINGIIAPDIREKCGFTDEKFVDYLLTKAMRSIW